MSAVRGRRPVAVALGRALAVALGAFLTAACGKKAPLQLPDQRAAERAAKPRASVGEGRLRLEFAVPAHRLFPEREEPWVLARVLRSRPPGKEFVEAGTILEPGGFPFGAPLAWTEEVAAGSGASAYRVEFRDAARRRRALSDPVEVLWTAPLPPPARVRAAGGDRAVVVSWEPPAGATAETRYRLYRREPGAETAESITPAAVPGAAHTDSRVQPSREYCYTVRATVVTAALETEGAASEEVCVRTEDATPPPPPAELRVSARAGEFQLDWEAVGAPDLLGYRVYRAIGEGPLELVTAAPVRGNAYREDARGAAPGTRYRFVVTAVDDSRRMNESPFSPAVEALTVPEPEAR